MICGMMTRNRAFDILDRVSELNRFLSQRAACHASGRLELRSATTGPGETNRFTTR
jgi:hypothetical protein